MAKRKISSALHWITKEAKRLKREYPNRFKKWTDYVAQASAIYSSKHKGKSPVGKKHATRRRRRSVGTVFSNPQSFNSVTISGIKKTKAMKPTRRSTGSTIARHKKAIRTHIEDKLASQLLRREKATTKRDRKKMSKLIRETKSDLKKYC